MQALRLTGALMKLDKNILQNRKIAIFTADGFDEYQLFSSKKALEDAGASVVIVSLKKGKIKAWQKDHWSKSIDVDQALVGCNTDEFDGLMIPGGEMYPDILLHDQDVTNFVKRFVNDGKSVATICVGTRFLIEAGMVKRKNLTTWPNLKAEALRAGAKWKNDEVVVDNGIITTRCSEESTTFIRKMIECFSISPRVNLIK